MSDLTVEWDDLDAAFEGLEAECAEIVRGMTVELWNGVLAKTPQFLGRMAASWSYSLEQPQFYDRSEEAFLAQKGQIDLGPFQGLWRGHRDAIAIANRHSAGHDSGFKLGMTVWLANGVDHGQGPYSQAIEDGEINLRMMNRPGTPVARSLDAIQAHYGAGIPARKVQQLKNLRIGGRNAADGN